MTFFTMALFGSILLVEISLDIVIFSGRGVINESFDLFFPVTAWHGFRILGNHLFAIPNFTQRVIILDFFVKLLVWHRPLLMSSDWGIHSWLGLLTSRFCPKSREHMLHFKDFMLAVFQGRVRVVLLLRGPCFLRFFLIGVFNEWTVGSFLFVG